MKTKIIFKKHEIQSWNKSNEKESNRNENQCQLIRICLQCNGVWERIQNEWIDKRKWRRNIVRKYIEQEMISTFHHKHTTYWSTSFVLIDSVEIIRRMKDMASEIEWTDFQNCLISNVCEGNQLSMLYHRCSKLTWLNKDVVYVYCIICLNALISKTLISMKIWLNHRYSMIFIKLWIYNYTLHTNWLSFYLSSFYLFNLK